VHCLRPGRLPSRAWRGRGFVHEVLRRSRTSGSILQIVLCYLEAIRLKVPELVERQRAGDEEDTGASNRIIQGDIEMSEETKFTETVFTSPRTADKTDGARISTQPSPLPPPPLGPGAEGKGPEVAQPIVISEDELELAMGKFEKMMHEETELLHHVRILAYDCTFAIAYRMQSLETGMAFPGIP
jgi:hypothetical protein